jgi:hypothetical protein
LAAAAVAPGPGACGTGQPARAGAGGEQQPVVADAGPVSQWLDGAASPLARVLEKLAPGEQEAFLKAMSLLETELRGGDALA